jgi:hypothetical protein
MERAGIWVLPGDANLLAEIQRATRGLAEQSDRAAALIATVILEQILTDKLKKHLHHHEKVADKLLDVSGALGDLALLWQIVGLPRFLGFPNQFFSDSWVVGSRRADHGGVERRSRTLAETVPGSVGS